MATGVALSNLKLDQANGKLDDNASTLHAVRDILANIRDRR